MKTDYQKPETDTVVVSMMSIIASTTMNALDAKGVHEERNASMAASRERDWWEE